MDNIDFGYIVNHKDASLLAQEYPFLGISPPFFTPEIRDIEPIQKYLPDLQRMIKDEKDMEIDMAAYNKQYIGYYDSNNEKIIYINFFCNKEHHENNDFVVMFDGGTCYFQARFNTASKKFFDLEINPEA